MHQLGYKMFVRKIRSNDAIREWAKVRKVLNPEFTRESTFMFNLVTA